MEMCCHAYVFSRLVHDEDLRRLAYTKILACGPSRELIDSLIVSPSLCADQNASLVRTRLRIGLGSCRTKRAGGIGSTPGEP